MFKFLLLICIFFFISACSTTSNLEDKGNELVIHSLTQGKMRKVNEEWIVYEKSNDMKYEENDTCVYNQKPISCLRHGFIISYDSSGQDIKLNCIAKTNITVNAGNTEEEKYVDTNEDDFYMSLKGIEKVFVNPQYVNAQKGLDDLYINTRCSYNDREVFNFSQRVRFD